ncbi:Beta-catenin-interacting ICAT [Pseudocohnilembus persalinus]|uniref:Beta-catenin-interacting ICAT n=1 Tax=Pseudocohnilembus persalinus TaxID=266149 RepID=A0A0V0R270_PSEPJ|nr:Beta-catenin-interacting ICAT [Pseudocohnilembus persalinus]|eukprot:KRX08604.1 Beta-catenin-interacting ICAT [Pseudocohnilembus persalinus]
MDKQFAENIEQQKKRLLQQLQELEELKSELEQEEYDQMKEDTLDQLEQFQNGLEKMQSNDLSLNDQINKAKIELQNAIKKAFNIEQIQKSMTTNQAQGLRDLIKKAEMDFNLGKITEQQYNQQKLTHLNNLQDLKSDLTQEEKLFLDKHTE